ncbi:MAG: glycosyltransferase family 2 protein [Leptospiraceae bacterium]|nr:glycosyltransferase family 2 protein [Leptospiraceae bacterium]
MADFSLIIPTFNEKDNICILIPKLKELFIQNSISYEIIVVDDDSPDLTWKIARDKFEDDISVRVIRRVGKKGLSSAVIDGMSVARGKYLGVIDADMQHDESILPRMLKEMEEYEVVIGSRKVEDGGYGEWGFIRKMMSKGATLVAKIFLPIPVKDPMSGFFIVRKELFDELVSSINPRGFKILLEFIGRKKQVKAKEVGYVFRTRQYGTTKMSSSVIQNYLAALYDIRFGKYISLTFLVYAFVGLIGLAINFSIRKTSAFVFADEQNQSPLSIPVLSGFIASLFSNYILNNIWTFKQFRISGVLQQIKGFITFSLISVLGLLIQLSVWNFLLQIHNITFMNPAENWLSYFYNFVGIVVATASNYYLNKNITWEHN